MKKTTFIFLSLFIAFASFGQTKVERPITCQEPDLSRASQATWAIAGTFNVTDIYGNNHNLADYLAAGKTVIVDLSAVSCSPCWSIHQSGVLDNLHNNYGPDGTDELVVLWVEIEGNSVNLIHGIGSGTQGDWTEGDTWPVPIIRDVDHQVYNALLELYEGFVPTVFMVCPSGYYKDVTSQTWQGATQVYNQIGSCPTTGQVPFVEINGPGSAFLGFEVNLSASIASVDPVTSYSWTFVGGEPETSDLPNPSVTWNSVGTKLIKLSVSNENGASPIKSKAINIIDPGNYDDKMLTFEEILVDNTYPSNFAPYNWTTVDMDHGSVYTDYDNYGISGSNNAFSVYSNQLTASNLRFPPYQGDKCAFAMTNINGNPRNNDWLISPKFALGTNSSFKFYAKSATIQWGAEEYRVAVSTTDNNPASFTFIGAEATVPASWTAITKDLSAYDGQEIYIALVYTGNDHFVFLADNLQLITTPTENIDIKTIETKVFPNPVNNILNVNFAENAKIQIFNNIGQEVYYISNALEYNQIDMSSFEAGSYIVRVTKDNKIDSHKMILVK